jgi:hypothetical protein
MVAWAVKQLGCPYIFAAAGQTCTPDFRRGMMKSKPDYAASIKKYCPVLSGKQAVCAGCKYDGKPSYDCRGLTRLALKAATGRMLMGAGATSQWNDSSNWASQGTLASMPETPCFLYKQSGSSMAHTGIYIGGGWCIHASGHSAGVIKSSMPRSWTHFGIPVGLYGGGEIPLPDEHLIRRRDVGERVRTLQAQLLQAGYPLPRYGADGDFGAETEAAVRQFQADYSLEIDGVWDVECQARLDERLDIMDDEPGPEPEATIEDYIVTLQAVVAGLIKLNADR